MGFTRKFLSASGLYESVRRSFRRAKIKPCPKSEYSWEDCLMSGLAVFGLKFPSLLQFDKQKSTEPFIRHNLKSLYGVQNAPSDTQLRERLDTISAAQIRKPFKQIFANLQRGKALESFRYLDGHYIISIDGTGQYSSKSVHCGNCCEKKSKKTGEITYYHQMLGASLVHPDKKVVIPLAPEPITKGDGDTKNDCERNASKRLLADLRREHPHLKVLIVEDGLASNYPHLSLIDSLKMNYIIGVKPGDHKYLFEWIKDLNANEHTVIDDAETMHDFSYYYDVPLNDSHHDYRVNVIEYRETKKSGKVQKFSWVSSIKPTNGNVYELMRAGRSRWKIENETFNTLKNQGYNFEHNFGHGNKNLCSVMTMLLLLSFLIDQAQQLCCKKYQKARKKLGALFALFESVRSLFLFAIWDGWNQLYDRIGWSWEDGPPEALKSIF
jgi:hypothetical protein